MRRLFTLALLMAGTAVTFFAQSAGFIITTASPLATAIFGQTYTPVTLDTANGLGSVAWSIVPANSGPSGFVVGSQPVGQPNTQGIFCYGIPTQNGTPACTGTVQTVPGNYTFIVVATSLTTNQTARKQFTLSVVQPLQITTLVLPDAAANQPYSFPIQTRGGSGQFTWSVPFGTLPPGIGLDPATGILSGTAPNGTGPYTFTIQVLDQATQATASAQYRLSIQGGIVITTTALPNGTLNQRYSFQLEETGTTTPLWSVQTGGTLPPQFSLSSSGLLTGFGITTGTFSIPIQLMDPETQVTTTRVFPFYITLGPLHIVENVIHTANQNVPYSATLTPAGGLPPYRWSFDIPSPQNLSISSSTGVISGTPPNAGIYDLPVTLRDSIGEVFSQSFALNVAAAVSITTTSLADGLPGVPYAATLVANGGSLPYTWSVSVGSLPVGLILNPTNGQISGAPAAQGASQFTIQVTDFSGGVATKVFTMVIGAGQLLTVTTASLPDGAVNQNYNQPLAATGGTLPLVWSLGSGSLPPGLTLNVTTGVISGTPTTLGNFVFDVVATDANNVVARKSLSINITTPLTITSGNFTGAVLAAFSQTLTATGGAPPYAWSISSGTLPAGLQLNSTTGLISGTPSAGGTSQLGVTATDLRNQTATNTISITITLPPPPATTIGIGTTTQPAVSLTTGAAYPVDITGTLTLTFASSVGGTDDMVRFSPNGTRSLPFTVPANTTQATFQTPNAAILTGTVAGTITLTASLSASGQNITPAPAPVKTITIDPAVPVITSVALQQVTGGINVVVTGYSNTREVSSGSFTFAVSSGNTLSQSQITVALTSAYTAWFNSTASNATGGQFKLTVPFTVTGSATAVTKVTVTLTNTKGSSAAASSP
jgi:hypothetical protein